MKNPKSLPFDKSNFSELRYFKRPAKALSVHFSKHLFSHSFLVPQKVFWKSLQPAWNLLRHHKEMGKQKFKLIFLFVCDWGEKG